MSANVGRVAGFFGAGDDDRIRNFNLMEALPLSYRAGKLLKVARPHSSERFSVRAFAFHHEQPLEAADKKRGPRIGHRPRGPLVQRLTGY